jgi:hypothetical protein
MSFNQGGSSGRLSFKPAKFNVDWDGKSTAKASFELACNDTAATYSAGAYRVWDDDTEVTCNSGTNESVYQTVTGERWYTFGDSCARVYASDFSLPITASNGVATVVFSSVPATATSFAHAWYLKATKGTAVRVLVAGKLQGTEMNPYEASGGSISLVSGVTAFGCF